MWQQNRVFLSVNSIHNPFVNPQLINTNPILKIVRVIRTKGVPYMKHSAWIWLKSTACIYKKISIIEMQVLCTALIYVQLICLPSISYLKNCRRRYPDNMGTLYTILCQIVTKFNRWYFPNKLSTITIQVICIFLV